MWHASLLGDGSFEPVSFGGWFFVWINVSSAAGLFRSGVFVPYAIYAASGSFRKEACVTTCHVRETKKKGKNDKK